MSITFSMEDLKMFKKFGVKLDVFRDSPLIRYAVKHIHESQFRFHGLVCCEHFRNGILLSGGWEPKVNTFTTEGMARLLNIVFRAQATEAAIYVGIFKNNVTPAVGDTAAVKLGAAGTYGECQDADYDSPATDKPAYTMASTSTAVATNAASKATFVMNASITVYGAFLSTAAAKTAVSGTLFCGKKFTASRLVIADDELAITYQIMCTTA
jgi:hypothetical protein